MKKALLLGVLLPILLAACSIAFGAQRFEAAAFQEACELSRYSCEGVELPMVAYDETSLVEGLWGYYIFGTNVVILARGLDPWQEYAVLVHELVHYLQYLDRRDHGYPGFGDKCAAEREAFEVSDQVMKRLGHPELARNGDLTNYGCDL